METSPWPADRILPAQAARAAIATCFPDVDSRTVKHLASGWEFDVYLTPDDWVFRFPRLDWLAGVFESERRTHDLVAPVLAPIAVPKVELIGEPTDAFPHRFAGHRFISGVSADKTSSHVEATLASEIGKALEAIHSIPVEKARAAGIDELDIEEPGRKNWLREGIDRAPGLRGLAPDIDPALDWLAQLSLTTRRYDGPLCLVHTDVTGENMLVDPDTGRLTGILDWTDIFLGDAAGDFARLVMWRGWEFTEEVLRSYHRPVDQAFRDRISFAARLISTIEITGAHARGMDVAVYFDGVRNAFESGALPNER